MSARRWLFSLTAIMAVIILQLVLTVRTLADDGVPPEETPVVTPTEVLPEETPLPPAPAEKDVIDGSPEDPNADKPGRDVIDDSPVSAEDPNYGDPVWCPEGHVPGDAECTPPHDTISDLIAYLQANSATYNGNGTIYFMNGTYTGPETTIVLDSVVLPELGSLTLFGGWDLDGTNTNVGTSTFTVSLEVLWDAAVTLIDLIFDLPGGGSDAGVFVQTTGDITVDNVTVTGGSSGAELINYSGTGNVTVTNSVFSDNLNIGLLVYSSGNVSITNVVADGNNNGILIDNSTGTGSVVLNNIFTNDNGWTGIDVRSAGDITLQNVTANNNLVGANLQTTAGAGNIFVSGSTFNGNEDIGLKAVTNEGNISVTNVTTDSLNEPGSFGAWLKSYGGGTITVTDSTFNNADTGLFVVGTGDVTINNVTAIGNAGDGMVVESGWVFACIPPEGIHVTVNGGTYQDNGGYGFAVYPGPSGTVTLAGTINFLNNGEGDYLVDLTRTCQPPPDEPPGKPWLIVNVTGKGDDPVSVDCEIYAGVIMIFPDEKRVKMECPITEEIVVADVLAEALPGKAPAGVTVLNGLNIAYDDLLLLPDTWAMITFPVPEGMEGKHFSILYWDTAANDGKGGWIEMPLAQFGGQVFPLHPDTPEDGLRILSGVCQNGGCVALKVNFTGTFILIAR